VKPDKYKYKNKYEEQKENNYEEQKENNYEKQKENKSKDHSDHSNNPNDNNPQLSILRSIVNVLILIAQILFLSMLLRYLKNFAKQFEDISKKNLTYVEFLEKLKNDEIEEIIIKRESYWTINKLNGVHVYFKNGDYKMLAVISKNVFLENLEDFQKHVLKKEEKDYIPVNFERVYSSKTKYLKL
jgi:ATP-dependent Zn protease